MQSWLRDLVQPRTRTQARTRHWEPEFTVDSYVTLRPRASESAQR